LSVRDPYALDEDGNEGAIADLLLGDAPVTLAEATRLL
jgi:hypothetical protein